MPSKAHPCPRSLTSATDSAPRNAPAPVAAVTDRGRASKGHPFRAHWTRLQIAPALLALLLPACGERDTPGLIERPLSASEREFRLVDSSMERFRYQTRPAAAADASPKPTGLVYDTPEGWTEKPGSPMRDISFTFGEKGEGECYVARLPGAGGGLAANVNRWRAQMGAAPLSDEEVAALPTRPLFGQPARFVAVDGPFSPGMGSNETFPDYRLMGLILSAEAGAVFVKMTGPKALVEQHAAAFDQFVSSLNVNLN